MYLFTAEAHQRTLAGKLDLTFRLWKTPHVTAGKTYDSGFGNGIVIDDLRLVLAGDVPADDLRRAGCADIESLMALAGEHTRQTVTEDTMLYRVQFHYVDEAPSASRPALSLGELRKRLARLDERSPRGPWTLDVLRAIEVNPQVVSTALARELDWERFEFKAHVRKLKTLGLTISHEVGYELSDLGQAYLDAVED